KLFTRWPITGIPAPSLLLPERSVEGLDHSSGSRQNAPQMPINTRQNPHFAAAKRGTIAQLGLTKVKLPRIRAPPALRRADHPPSIRSEDVGHRGSDGLL